LLDGSLRVENRYENWIAEKDGQNKQQPSPGIGLEGREYRIA